MNTLKEIEAFFSADKIAVAGVSRNEKKFGSYAYKELKNRGLNVVAVNPHTDEIMGDKCYRSLHDIEGELESVLIVTAKDKSRQLVEDCLSKKVKNIWIQQMAQTDETLELAKSHQGNLVSRQCIMMFLEPVKGIHKFHGNLKKIFGKYPAKHAH